MALRGANYGGYEYTPIQGYNPDDPSGAQAGQPHGPNLDAMTAWGLNCLRLPLNQAAWLGQICYDERGILRDPDPRRRYRSDLIKQVTDAIAKGMRVILDLHWSAPANIAPMAQNHMADMDNSPAFWASLAAVPEFKSNPMVDFEMFNEPILTFAIQSGGTKWQVWKSGGVMDYAMADGQLNNPAWLIRAMTLTNPKGHFRPGSTITAGGITAIVVDHDLQRNRIYYRNASGSFVANAAVSVQAPRYVKQKVGQAIPAFAPSGTAANAVDGNYANAWRSSGAITTAATQRLAIDISSLTTGSPWADNRSRPVLVSLHAEDTYGYDNSRLGGTYFNLPAGWDLQVNTAPGGTGTAPTGGWVTLASITTNTYIGRQFLFNRQGYNWLGFNFNGVNGSPGNADVNVNVDFYDCSDTVTGTIGTGLGTNVADGVMFVGDSIMANAMGHGSVGGVATTFADTVFGTTGHRPCYQGAGMPNWKTTNLVADDGTGQNRSVLQQWLDQCPLKYVVLAIGANDAGPGGAPATSAATFSANLLTLAQQCIAAGRIPIIPTISFSPNAARNANVVALNSAIASLLAGHPEILAGADQYAYFQANPSLIDTDQLHPTPAGNSNLRTTVWGGWAASTLYSPTAAIANPNAGYPGAGMDQLVAAVRSTGATNRVLCGGTDYANDLSQWAANKPTDSGNNLCAAWHPYQPIQAPNAISITNAGTGYAVNDRVRLAFPNTCMVQTVLNVTSIGAGGAITGISTLEQGSWLQTQLPTGPVGQESTGTGSSRGGAGTGATFTINTWTNLASQWSMPVNWPTVTAIVNGGNPVHCTEIGGRSYSGAVGSPWITQFTSQWADANAASVIGWFWNSQTGWQGNVTNTPPGDPNNNGQLQGAGNVMIKDGAGTPSDGYGVTFRAWSLAQVQTSINVARGTTFDTRVFAPYIKNVLTAQSSTVGVQVPPLNCAYYIPGGTGAVWTLVNKPTGMPNPDANGLIAAWTPTTAETKSFQITCTTTTPNATQSTAAVNWNVASSSPAVDITTLQLTSVPGGTGLPFTVGHTFKQGDVPSGQFVTTDGLSSQAEVRNRWSDGSVKYAVISGTKTLTANVAGTLKIQKTGTAPSGTNIAEPSAASLGAGGANECKVMLTGAGAGTYYPDVARTNGATAWNRTTARKVREILGPVMSEFHYYTPTSDISGSSGHLGIWWFLRVYPNRIEVETAIEQGWLNIASVGNKTYTYTVSVAGTTVASGTNLNHRHHARWSCRGWVGGSPQITPAHNLAYLASTKLIPNYRSGLTIGGLTGYTQAAAPMTQANLDTDARGTGAHNSLGIMAEWDAAYFVSGDKRAYNGVLSNEQAANCTDIAIQAGAGSATQGAGFVNRDHTTGLPPVLSSYTSLSYNDGNIPAGSTSPTSAVCCTDRAHNWNAGYAAYLITGRWFSLETMQFNVTTEFFLEQANRVYNRLTNDQDRGVAWAYRSAAACLCMTPDSHPLRSEYLNYITQGISNFRSSEVGFNSIGIRRNVSKYEYTDYLPQLGGRWFMQYFMSQAFGFAYTIIGDALGADTAGSARRNFRESAQFLAQWPTGLTGLPATYPYMVAANYEGLFGPTGGDGSAATKVWATSFAQVASLNGRSGMTDNGQLQGGNFPDATSYWGNLMPALCYAVDLAASGETQYVDLTQATPGYKRVTNASNFGSINWGAAPQWAAAPLTPTTTTVPTHITNATAGGWTAIGSNKLRDVKNPVQPLWNTTITPDVSGVMYPWCGGCYDDVTHTFYVQGGGHNDYDGNEVYGFQLDNNVWARVTQAANYNNNGGQSPYPTNGVLADGSPMAVHTYNALCCDANGAFYRLFNGGAVNRIHKLTVAARSSWPTPSGQGWSLGPTWPSSVTNGDGTVGTGTCFDPVGNAFYGFASAFSASLYRYNVTAGTTELLGNWNAQTDYYRTAACDYVNRLVVVMGGGNNVAGTPWPGGGIGVYNINTGAFSIPTTTGTKPSKSEGNMAFDSKRGRFVYCERNGIDLYALQLISGTWTWSKLPLGGVTPTAANTGSYKGLFGKFDYCADYDVFIMTPTVEGSSLNAAYPNGGGVFIYKPAGWTPPP